MEKSGNRNIKRMNVRIPYKKTLVMQRRRRRKNKRGGNKEGGQRAQEPQWRRIRTSHFVMVMMQWLELTQSIGIEGAIGQSVKEGNRKG